MKSSFSRLFFPVVTIMLIALMVIGLFFQFQIQSYMQERAMEKLKINAETIADLAGAYYADPTVDSDGFLVNLSTISRTTQSDAVLCDSTGRLLLCADDPLGCEHQGMVIADDYLEKVLSAGTVYSTGKIEGLYSDNRYVVSRAVKSEGGEKIGIVIASSPVSSTLTVVSRILEIYLFITVIVVLLTVLFVWFYVRRQSVPLRDMARTARKFGHGELDARVAVDETSSEEMQELALAFNNMASSLQKSEYQRQEFVANVSHELKTPMTTISGFVDGILDGTIPPERQEYYLSMVSDETKRLSRLVRSMLDISRLQDEGGIPEEKKTRFEIQEAVGQVLITFEQKILAKKLDIQVQMPEYPVFTRANQDPITQVIYNLVENAVKFCPEGGTVWIKVHSSGAKIYLSIANQGDTIPAQELPLVFDRFHKLDKSRSKNREGWGLGLYIVKTIICSHGENISVASQDGVTEFTFTLPLVN